MQSLHVHTTKDYGLFKSVDGNRNINYLHKNRLKKSMQEKQLINPIIVNEKHEIIDGQHRFSVCQELGLPIHYLIIPGYGLEDVHRMNQNSKNWNQEDFLAGYCDMGLKDYLLFREFKDSYDFGFTVSLAIANNNGVGNTDLEVFRNGEFKFHDYVGAIERADRITSLKVFTDQYNTKLLVYAILFLLKNQRFDFNQLFHKLNIQRGLLIQQPTTSGYIKLFEEIYNYRSREKVSLRY